MIGASKSAQRKLYGLHVMGKALIYHVQTGVVCGRFDSIESAQAWLDQYGVTQAYKDANYRIELADTFYARVRPSIFA